MSSLPEETAKSVDSGNDRQDVDMDPWDPWIDLDDESVVVNDVSPAACNSIVLHR
jgi:hypothetical protein